jgi:hypothetical protein
LKFCHRGIVRQEAAEARRPIWIRQISALIHHIWHELRPFSAQKAFASLARAEEEGKTLDRPKIDPATEKAIRAALSKGDEGMHKIAARLGVGTGADQGGGGGVGAARSRGFAQRDRIYFLTLWAPTSAA